MVENNKEIWKDVPGFEGYYQASNLGRVRSLDRTITDKNGVKRFYKGRLIDGFTSDGYKNTTLRVNSKGKSFRFSQLVAMAFLNHKPNGMKLVVDHINGDRSDDRVENLRIVTFRENVTTCFRSNIDSLTSKYVGVYWSLRDSIWVADIRYNRLKISLGYFNNELDASNAYQSALSEIKQGTFNPENYKPKFSSSYKGVNFHNRDKKWVAQIQVNLKKKHLGYFTNEIEAAQAYNDYIINNNLNRKLNEIS